MSTESVGSAVVLRPGIYRHYKGNLYEVLGVAQHSETHEQLVVYRALYGDFGLWVRPLTMFTEDVVHEGCRQPRFAFLPQSPSLD